MKNKIETLITVLIASLAVVCLVCTIVGMGNSIKNSVEDQPEVNTNDLSGTHVFYSMDEYIEYMTANQNGTSSLNALNSQSGYYIVNNLPDDAVLESIEVDSSSGTTFIYSLRREPNIEIEPDEEVLLNMFTQLRVKTYTRNESDINAFIQNLASAIGAAYNSSEGKYIGSVTAEMGWSTGRLQTVTVGKQTLTLTTTNEIEYKYIPVSLTDAEAEQISSTFVTINNNVTE